MLKRPKALAGAKSFEAALAVTAPAARYCLKLFITGTTPRCARAIKNIRAICEDNLPGQYDLEVIDIYQHPEQARPEQIVVTPTLVKLRPLPFRRLIGDMSDNHRVLLGLDITRRPASAKSAGGKHGS